MIRDERGRLTTDIYTSLRVEMKELRDDFPDYEIRYHLWIDISTLNICFNIISMSDGKIFPIYGELFNFDQDKIELIKNFIENMINKMRKVLINY